MLSFFGLVGQEDCLNCSENIDFWKVRNFTNKRAMICYFIDFFIQKRFFNKTKTLIEIIMQVIAS